MQITECGIATAGRSSLRLSICAIGWSIAVKHNTSEMLSRLVSHWCSLFADFNGMDLLQSERIYSKYFWLGHFDP